jgi:hypothetical protein
MSDIKDDAVEEFYTRTIAEYTKQTIDNAKNLDELVLLKDGVVNLYYRRIVKADLVPLPVAIDMLYCGYDPLNETEIEEFYDDIVESVIVDIAKAKKKKRKNNVIPFPGKNLIPFPPPKTSKE